MSSATTLIVYGTGFASTAGGNSVQLSSGAATVAAATSTQLTLTLTSAPSTGTLTAVVTSLGISSGSAVQVANVVNPQYMYVTNNNVNQVTGCLVSGSTISGCAASSSSAFNQPYGIAVSGANAFVTNYGGRTVVTCARSGTALSSCSSTGSGFTGPTDITLVGGTITRHPSPSPVTITNPIGITIV